jgi:hypothetical protein
MAHPKHSPDLFRELLNALVREPHTGPKRVCAKHRVSAASFYSWQQQSAEAERAGLTESPFLVEWLGNVAWFHRHCAFCRAVSIAQIDSRIIEGATCSRFEPLYNPQTGTPFWEVDPRIAADAKSLDNDAWELVYGLGHDKSDIYKRDENGALIQATKEVPPDPRLLLKAAASLLPGVYADTVHHEVMVGGVLRIGSSPPTQPRLPPPVDVDFLTVDDVEAPEKTNVLAVANPPSSVQEFEETFGGRRLVEAVLFYSEAGQLLPPLDGIVIVTGSPIHQAYREAGIEVQTTPASDLIREGYCNEFLLKLATPADQPLVNQLREKLKAGVKHPLPTHGSVIADAVAMAAVSLDTTLKRSNKPHRIDAGEQLGYGQPPAGGRRV